jgi:2-polyprenyl-3-methyl-5-hydroxy-6-metoxy-1,4-benzoquinol methylase
MPLACPGMPSREYYDALWEQLPPGLEPAHFGLRRRFLLDRVRAGQRLLDVGCAEGLFARELVQADVHVFAVDVACEPLRRARARVASLETQIIPLAGPWPLPDASFDVVWSGETIEHVPDTAAWLSEIRRVLRPGGRLLLSTPHHGALARLSLALSRRAFERHFDPLGEHLRFYTRRSLTGLLHELGFPEARVFHPSWPPAARAVLFADVVRARW